MADTAHVTVRASSPNSDTVTATYTLTRSVRNVTLTSADSTKTYDGTALTNHRVIVGGDSLVAGESFNYTVTGSQTNAGSSENTFTYTAGTGTQLTDYDITPTPGTLTVTKCDDCITLNVPGTTEKKYDGDPFGPAATVSDTIAGDVIKIEYSTDGGTTWTTDVPSITHVADGPQTVLVRGSNANYDTVQSSYTLTVTPRDLTLTSGSGSKEYDGTALTNGTVTPSGDGFVAGESFDYTVTGSQTTAGSSANTFTYTASTGTQLTDYAVTPTPGTLTVTKSNDITLTVPETTTKSPRSTTHDRSLSAYSVQFS